MGSPEVTTWESEMHFDLRTNRWLLTPVGLWVSKNNDDRFLVKFCILFTLFILGIFLFPHGLYALLVETDRLVQLKMFGPISYCIMAIGKYLIALKNKRGIADCMNFLADNWRTFTRRPEEKRFLLEASRWCENFTELCIFFMMGGTMSYMAFIPIIEYASILLKTPNGTLMLVFPSYFGKKSYDVSTDHGFMFGTLFFAHTITFTFVNMITVGLCTLVAKLVMHVCCRIKVMTIHLESASDSVKDEKRNSINHQANFKSIIVKHMQILRFIFCIEKTFTGVFFIEFTGSTCGICMLGYYIIAELERRNILQAIMYTFILLSYVTNIFIYCYLGNELTEQCRRVGIKAYEINWTHLLSKENKMAGVHMIILISQHPPKLSAGKVIFLTMETFSSVIKVAATYFNVLRKVTTVD